MFVKVKKNNRDSGRNSVIKMYPIDKIIRCLLVVSGFKLGGRTLLEKSMRDFFDGVQDFEVFCQYLDVTLDKELLYWNVSNLKRGALAATEP